MEYWSEITNETLENARKYKKQEQERQHICINESLIDSEGQEQYEKCSESLLRNWQVFMLKLEWERHKLQDCLTIAKKANIKADLEVKKMCCGSIKQNIQIVGYSAFQSYGDLPYPSLKAGKRTLDSNEIWEQTVRNEDKESFYKNSNYHYSNKQVSLDSTVQPPHYTNVYKANKARLESATSNDFFQKTGNSALTPENPLLKTGCEHWKSTYQASIVDPYAKNRAIPPEWSLNRPPYVVETKVGPSEYKKQYGQIGENPRDRLNQLDETHPRTFDELRLGTSQEAQHIPGYTGFMPSIITNSKAIEHGRGTEPRTDFMKTNLKENYHTKIPGYAGHVPRSVVNQRDQPRESCFSN